MLYIYSPMDGKWFLLLPSVHKKTCSGIHCKSGWLFSQKVMSSQFHPNSYLAWEPRKLTLEAHNVYVCYCSCIASYYFIPSYPSLSEKLFENQHQSVFPTPQVVTTQLRWRSWDDSIHTHIESISLEEKLPSQEWVWVKLRWQYYKINAPVVQNASALLFIHQWWDDLKLWKFCS